jgi:hypothetical protein
MDNCALTGLHYGGLMNAKRVSERAALWAPVAALTCVGLALRIAAARGGGLWTDEAWSMLYAEDARDPMGVFFRINHDNNHHLISLWLQAVGVHASPLLARLPAIVAGMLTIPVGALIFARRSTVAATAAAALFAISPIMVTYGSEARGYALMILAALVLLWLAIGALDGRGNRGTAWWMGLAALLGMFSHLTMLAPVGLLTVWIYLEKRSAVGSREALPATLKLLGPAIGACAFALAFVFLAAKLSPLGMRLGGYRAFTFGDYSGALADLSAWTVGLPFTAQWLAPIALLALGAWLMVRPPQWLGESAKLYGILILGVPAGILVERTGNALFARYYLCSAIGLLLLAADWIGHAMTKRGLQRVVCSIACGLSLGAGIWHDRELVDSKRGEPDRALRIIAQEEPRGAQVAFATPWLFGPLVAAAQHADYPLSVTTGCGSAQFLFASRKMWTKPTVMYCGRPMQAIAWSDTTPLTGDAWVLYRGGLQTAGPPVSGPPPRRGNPPPPRRAGVAQG